MASGFLAALQRAVEEGERGDWAAYALGRPQGRRKSAMRPVIADLLAEAAVPSLQLRAALFAVDADPQAAALSSRAEAREEAGDDPADTLVQLFARKELLARRAGYAGYAQLALAADGLTEETVMRELAQSEQRARRAAAIQADSAVGTLPSEADVCARFRSFFAPLLDEVEVRLDPEAPVLAMSAVSRWPDDISVVIRCAETAAPATERIVSLGATGHELGHVLQWRARACRGLGFLDFFSLTAVEAETAAELGERLLFESELGREMPLPRAMWSKQRALDTLRQIGRARFEMRAYAAALSAPRSLPALWAAHADARDERDWSLAGHGFYTDDPMRRYSYPLAYVRASRTLSRLTRPLTPQWITQAL